MLDTRRQRVFDFPCGDVLATDIPLVDVELRAIVQSAELEPRLVVELGSELSPRRLQYQDAGIRAERLPQNLKKQTFPLLREMTQKETDQR